MCGRLLTASEQLARQRGCSEIHLSVYLDNFRAIKLYERMGWEKRAPDGVWQGFMFKLLVPIEGHAAPLFSFHIGHEA